MNIYIDTSAFLAILDPSDHRNARAIQTWQDLIDSNDWLVTSSYVMIESISILHNRFSTPVVQRFLSEIVPIVEVDWADVGDHTVAVGALLSRPGKGGPSLVDCMSFETIRKRKLQDVFVYDRHFEDLGFNLIGQVT